MKYKKNLLCALALLSVCAIAGAPQTQAAKGPGYVDSTPFVDIAGDDAVSIEVDLSGDFLKDVDLETASG